MSKQVNIALNFNETNPITNILYKKIIQDNKEKYENNKENQKIYPSSLYKCSRQILYEMLGYKKEMPDPRIFMIMDNGNYVHERYEKLFKEAGILIASEAPIKDETLRISGRIDAIISVNDVMAIAELKSANSKTFESMRKSNSVDIKYLSQIQLYMHLTGFDLGVVVVENKDTQEILEFWTEYDEEMAKGIIKKITTINKYFDEKKLIPRSLACELDKYTADKNKLYKGQYEEYCYYCRYCDFIENCYNE